jgi:Mn-dependent DtxR family transcriptional regulator
MSPEESQAALVPLLLVQLYRDAQEGGRVSRSFYEVCEELRIAPSLRTTLLRALLAEHYVRRKAEGHVCLTDAGKQIALAALDGSVG